MIEAYLLIGCALFLFSYKYMKIDNKPFIFAFSYAAIFILVYPVVIIFTVIEIVKEGKI